MLTNLVVVSFAFAGLVNAFFEFAASLLDATSNVTQYNAFAAGLFAVLATSKRKMLKATAALNQDLRRQKRKAIEVG